MDLRSLVNRIQSGDDSAATEFYNRFARGIRLMIKTRLQDRPEVDDAVQDTPIAVFKGIQLGRLSQPEALPQYIAGTIRHIVAGYLDKTIRARSIEVDTDDPTLHLEAPRVNVLADAERVQTRARIQEILAETPGIDREILTRLYINEDTPAAIQRDLGLTETQYRLRKSRAKARLVEAFQKKDRKAVVKFRALAVSAA